MLLRSIVPSPKGALSLQEILQLTDIYLENAIRANDNNVVLVLCHNAEVALSQAKNPFKKSSSNSEDRDSRLVAAAYFDLGKLLEGQGHQEGAQALYKRCKKWGGHDPMSSGKSIRPLSIIGSNKRVDTGATLVAVDHLSQEVPFSQPTQGNNYASVSEDIFPKNLALPNFEFKPPEPDSRLTDTPQLARCLGLLQAPFGPNDVTDTVIQNWLQVVKSEPEEHDRLKTLATDVIRAFKRDEFKNAKAVTEVVYLAPILEKDDFRYLLKEFHYGIEKSSLLDVHQLEGLAQLIQGAESNFLDADDLVKVLDLFSTRLRTTHQQSVHHIYQLTLAVANVLDAMADANVKGLDRETIHAPLLSYLDGLKGSSDPYLVYQAAYAYQALLYVPDNESIWQATLRRTGKVVKGISGLVSAMKSLDLNTFIESLGNIQQGLESASDVLQIVKNAYDQVSTLAKGGQSFLECLKEGLSFSRKCAWYPALRGADTMIQDGQFAEFKNLVCEAPCRRDAAFQWGVCQRLGQVAANTMWDGDTRQSAIAFLGEIYRNDTEWGQQATVKQWILDILMQLTVQSGEKMNAAVTLLQELQTDGDATKQDLYRKSRDYGPGLHPLIVGLPAIGSPSLLDRIQERPLVEGNIRQLRRTRLKERGDAVYIQPQAKAGLQTRDETRFPLMEKVDEFLVSNQTVFLLLGESGAGKSTFNRQLECHLWETYRGNSGAVPLFINLPAIEKPEHDMISKQLRRCEFTEPQIRELKLHRKFILICDGYDESQQTHNLYTSNRLNGPGEWQAKMVVSCRSEYLGVDYQDRFQPGGRNQRSESMLFQEAVITPFSWSQVQEYINQYVTLHQPLWEAEEYKKALDHIPSLKELVKNPFLMSLSLEVLPRMVDPGQNLSATHITRVELYDQFIENWLERGKKRLGEKNLGPLARAAFESLSDEGFIQSGIDYLKRLSKAIYKNQGGQPIVRYSRYKDENTWKAEFFSREEEKQLLREACPLVRNSNQHRFVHRSLLEYGVSLAVFDPHDWKEKMLAASSMNRRGSVSSVLSFDTHDPTGDETATVGQGPDLQSPLAWRHFVNEPSVLQFLEERVHQEPLFKQQLLDYIEHSKVDKKWRTAAANAITILVRVGVQFNHADLRGIQIPKADLSYGIFNSAQLQGADLRHVDLRGAWLRDADLNKAQMMGAQFGELPYLEQESAVSMCAYSRDGKSLSVALSTGHIVVYSTSNWEKRWTLEGHELGIIAMIYSRKGDRMVSGSYDSTLRIWDTGSGNCCYILVGHEAAITSVSLSPRGEQFMSTSHDKTVKLWDMESGACLHTMKGHLDYVNCAVYSPQDDQIASCSGDGTIRLWSTNDKECIQTLHGHDGDVTVVQFSPRGNQVASAGDCTVRLWDTTTGDCLCIMIGHKSRVWILVYSTKGDQLATACSSNVSTSVRLWDTETGRSLHTLVGHNDTVFSVDYSPQGDIVATASHDGTVRLWDTETGVCRQTLNGHTSIVSYILFSPKGDQVASCGNDKTVRLWDGVGVHRRVASGHDGLIKKIQYSPREGQVATCSQDSTVRIWDVKTGPCIHILRGHTGTVCSISYSPQGEQLATGSEDHTVRLWNVETGSCTQTLYGHTKGVYSVVYSPDGTQLASGSHDQTVRLFDVVTGKCQVVLSSTSVYCPTYSPNGRQIATACRAGSARLWDTTTGDCLQVLCGHDDWVNRFVFSPAGDLILTSSDDNTARLWDAATGTCRKVFRGHNREVASLAYSPKGDQIAYGQSGGSVELWDVVSGTSLWTLEGHFLDVQSIVYSQRGDLLISASMDRTVRVWDVASGQCRAVIEEFQDEVNEIAWIESSEHNYLIAICEDGTGGLWQVTMDQGDCQAKVIWRTIKGELTVETASIQGAQGLTQLNRQLLQQRGSIGEPIQAFRDASKKVVSLASAVSRLMSAGKRTAGDVSDKTSPLSSRPEE